MPDVDSLSSGLERALCVLLPLGLAALGVAGCEGRAPVDRPECAEFGLEESIGAFYVDLDEAGERVPFPTDTDGRLMIRELELIDQTVEPVADIQLNTTITGRAGDEPGAGGGLVSVMTEVHSSLRPLVGERFTITSSVQISDCMIPGTGRPVPAHLVQLSRPDGSTEAAISWITPVRPDGEVLLPFAIDEIRAIRVQDVGCADREGWFDSRIRTGLPVLTLADGTIVESPVGQEILVTLGGIPYSLRVSKAELPTEPGDCGELNWSLTRAGFIVPTP